MTNTAPLAGKRALVCGGSQGIGRACAVEIARLGARVTLLSRNTAALRTACDELPPPAEGGAAPHEILVADMSDSRALDDAVRGAIARSGAFHILVNNSGGPPAGAAIDAQPADFASAFAAHVLASQTLAVAVVPGMKAAGYGRIVNIISTSVKQPIRGLGVSNVIRGAVASWAKTLATELAPFGITVNNVLPGATMTDRLQALIAAKARATGKSEDEIAAAMKSEIPAGRFARPEEVAAAAAFLATPAAGYITGINLPVDGGRTGSL